MISWRKITFPRQPIKNVLFVGFGGLILLAVAVVLYLGLNYTTKLTKEYHHLLIETALNNLTEEVENLLIPVENQAHWIGDQVKNGFLDIDDYSKVETFMRGVLGATPNVTGVGILYRDGITRYFMRSENKWVEEITSTQAENDFIFSQMEKRKTTYWGELFWFDDIKQTIIDVQTPLYKNGELKGVLFIGVTVADLSKIILATSTDRFLTPFILYGRDHLLAHPILTSGQTISLEQAAEEINGVIPLPKVNDFQDTVLAQLIRGNLVKARLISPIDGVDVKAGRVDDDMHIVATRELLRFGKTPWKTGVYINAGKSDSTVAYNLFKMAAAGVLVLIISVFLSIKIGRKMARPIVRLADAAKSVRKGLVDPIEPLPRSRVRELDQAALAFNEMVEGLRERDMIREVFGRYVPESIASSLMKESGELSPISTEATILFSDIEGFTKLTEEVGPDRIVAILNAYFSAVVEILERHGGVVTQFQGDAVLATFNVPIESPDHAQHALDAAIEIREMLSSKTFEGVKLHSRIGLNTGSIVAGAVGAKGRLNYTVHGDAVNLAARIENLNKDYGTDLLISEDTANSIKGVELETVGTTSVRGRNAKVKLFVIKS